MPQSERPTSPAEEQNSEQYNINQLDQDLYELFEEQQILLDIVTQQQEYLDRQLETHRILMNEPPARTPTPLPEVLLEEINDDDETVVEEPLESESQIEPELVDIAEEEDPQVDPQLNLQLEQMVHPPRCNCNMLRRQFQVDIMVNQIMTGAQCTPPKSTGLGYDTAFSYPRRVAKGRIRRALLTRLVWQMQRCMTLINKNGCHPLPLAPQRPPLVITELPKKNSNSKMAKTKPESTSTSAGTTGALPKPRRKRFNQTLNGAAQIKASATKRLRKRIKKTIMSEHEIDMDCEFGMDHIQKFRSDRVREDLFIDNHKEQSETAPEKPIEILPLPRDRIVEDEISVSMSGLSIFEQASAQSWTDNPRPGSQLETRPCTPDLVLPAVLESNGLIDLMPSTSAQARANALAIHQEGASSNSSSPRSTPPPFGEYLPPNAIASLSKLSSFVYKRSTGK